MMDERKEDFDVGKIFAWLGARWVWLVLIAWAVFATWYTINRWGQINAFALGDTDDNMRMSQVRALLAGQDWFDLRQYKLNPPTGANIHWSRIVDLPLAGLILLLRPFFGGAHAEQVAVAIAPLIPLGIMLTGLALTVRRLVAPGAIILAFIALFFAGSTSGMFMPLRIDHHGWQLAMLSILVAGLADPRRARGGATVGIATAVSLSIGLEMLIYIALAGAATVLMWIWDGEQRKRLAAYSASLAGGTAIGFLLFASYANRQAVCDALSPVWLSDALLGGAMLFAMAFLSPADWKRRLFLAAAAAAVLAGFHIIAWPNCLSRLEGVSPEVEQLWLSHVREARPLYRHGWRIASLTAALPITGLIGWALLIWSKRTDRARLPNVLAAAAPGIAATLLLLWQTRTGPAAQMLAMPGAAALVWTITPWFHNSRHMLVRTLGVSAAIVVGLGGLVPLVVDSAFDEKPDARDRAIGRANAGCASMRGLRPVAQQPKGMVFTFVDLGPRLITVTHHTAVTGPYHRNGEQIADVMKAFRGSPDQARAILSKYRADYLLICPNSSTSTIFLAEAPKGFYAQLNRGQVPNWLAPVALPAKSPFRMWRVAPGG